MKRFYIYLLLICVPVTILISCAKEGADGLSADFGGTTGKAGSLSRFTIVGNYLYAVDQTSLNIFNITNPSNTVKVATQGIGFDIETIFPYNDKLFIGSSSAMYIYSLANPAAPQLISQVQHFRSCDPVVANDTVAYVTLRGGTRCAGNVNALMVYNITNIIQPRLVTQINLNGPFGLGYIDNGLYVCDGNDLRVYNIANSNNPVPVTTITNTDEKFYDVIPYGNLLIAYIDHGVALYNITNRLQPILLSKITN